MSLVVERPHSKYGSAILIRNDLKVKKIYERVQGTGELITIVMPGVVVHSVKGYNPDLIFASESIANMCKKSVMDPIPLTQHRHICVSVQPVVVPQPTPFHRRFNLRKADWNGYSTELDNSIEDVEPIPSNYNRFVENVRVASRRQEDVELITFRG